MDKQDRQFINEIIYRKFLSIGFESVDAGDVANALTDEVAEDVEETADSENWHSGDAEMALARVLKKRPSCVVNAETFSIIGVAADNKAPTRVTSPLMPLNPLNIFDTPSISSLTSFHS